MYRFTLRIYHRQDVKTRTHLAQLVWIQNCFFSNCSIMAEGFRFMPLSLVRLGTFRLRLLMWDINAGVHAHARSVMYHSEMSQYPRWETGLQSAGNVTHHKRAEYFGDFEKVSLLSWVLPREKMVDFRLLAVALRRVSTCWRGRWNSQNRKNVYLSPYVEEPLNSKVIKSFVPELRSCKCFSCFEIAMFYVYMLWTFHVHFTRSHSMAMVHNVAANQQLNVVVLVYSYYCEF